ncbi:DNA fragmentation factor subunit beta isoform X2 [Sceloporus undulatus]|uniref:DNA fragmentation factor subunit beta isoform X2 n=1 Tax=Sceloporus undulatus TaxID=8520 RepID=UPI001C4C87C4|nr:DNA fragmentation factor subunit beta isoform X2 [Sceloporus undulatus]
MAPKAFKVRGPEGGRKFGVAAKSLKELLAKARALLQLPSPGSRLCLYEDGTEMTEAYFKKVEGNSELILLPPGEKWQGYVSEIQRFLDAFSSRTDDIVRAAQGLLSDEQAPKKRKLLADLIHNLSENIAAESRADDEKWFQGVESRFKTKSSYMRYSCESRIRGYMKEVSSYASAIHPPLRTKFQQIAEAMMEKLKSERYNGCYFDRREEENVCLCTPEGWFSCQGPFDTKDCPCRHSINPYGNKESRILFSTWNLDHVIEKKRTILPTLAEAIKDRDKREVDWEYFYRLLFTVDNLKLVHIACHKKTNHNLGCDKKKIYQKTKHARRIRK